MERRFETSDIIVGLLAAIGVVVLIAVFVYVVKNVLLKNTEGE
jgi:hypothetical protein